MLDIRKATPRWTITRIGPPQFLLSEKTLKQARELIIIAPLSLDVLLHTTGHIIRAWKKDNR